MQYIIYCRRSSETEDKQVLSIDAQERELLGIAKRDGLNVVKIFRESMSAKDEGRPVFNEMMKYIERNPNTGIITWKIDRLARNMSDGGKIMDFLQRNIIREIRTHDKICLPNDNVLMLSVEFGMSNQYVRDLSVNVKRGNREKLSRGEWPNHAPFGYVNDKVNKKVLIDKDKAHYVRRVFEMYSCGVGYIEIANTLYDEGLRTNTGKKVYHSLFQRMINNPFYMGVMLRDGKLYPGNHIPLISKEVFDKAQEMATTGSRPRPKNHLFPLRGFLRCASCDCLLTASLKKGHHYYYCTNGKQKCEEHKSYMRENYLYPLVASLLDKLHFDEELIEIMYEAAKERILNNGIDNSLQKENLNKTLEMLRGRESRLLDTHIAELIDKNLYEAKMLEIRNEKVLVSNQINQLDQSTNNPLLTLEPIKNVFIASSRAKKEFLEADDFKKQDILKNLLWNLSFKDKNIVSYSFKKEFSIIEKSPKTGDFSMMLPD